MTKRAIAQILKEIAFFLLLMGANPYKARAYEQAGKALLICDENLDELIRTSTLTRVKGIGRATASVILELWQTGESAVHQSVQGSYPTSLVELGDVPGLTIKQIRRLYDQAGIRSLSDLQVACRGNHLLTIKGIGPHSQAKLCAAVGEFQRRQGYHLYANVLEEAAKLDTRLQAIRGVQLVAVAGALRRKLEVINQYSFVLCCDGRDGVSCVAEGVGEIPNVDQVATHPQRVTARSPMGLPINIWVVRSNEYGMQLLRETGSEEHLEQLLTRFSAQGLTTWEMVGNRLKGADEQALYHAIGLPLIPPELREGRDELQRIQGLHAPVLIEGSEIQGFFHCHTDYSDGTGTVEDMVVAARAQGFTYVGISDHSQSATYAHGLKEPRVRRQWAEIQALQAKYRDIHIFRGIEADILPDGSMDYPDPFLAEFDFVIASVHSRFNLSEMEQTRRVCQALAHPSVTMLGHPTGRLLLSRPGYHIDLEEVIEVAARFHKPLEINGSRYRLDLDWRMVRVARARGVKFCINPDAHAIEELRNMSFGLNVARKGGLQAQDVINTQSLLKIKAFLSKMRGLGSKTAG